DGRVGEFGEAQNIAKKILRKDSTSRADECNFSHEIFPFHFIWWSSRAVFAGSYTCTDMQVQVSRPHFVILFLLANVGLDMPRQAHAGPLDQRVLSIVLLRSRQFLQ